MKIFKKNTSVLILSLALASCINGLEEINTPSNSISDIPQESTRSLTDSLEIVYHGESYKTAYMITEGSTYIYQNSKVRNLIDNLNLNQPNLMTFFHKNGIIEFFDNEDDFKLNKKRLVAEHRIEKKSPLILSREGWFPNDNKPYLSPADPVNNEVEIHLYEDELYLGGYFALARTRHDSDYSQVDKVWNFGGDITSMIVHTIGVGGIFTFYDVMECQGKSFTMIIEVDDSISLPFSNYAIATPDNSYKFGSLFMIDLRDVYWYGIAGNWSDRICCIKVERYIGSGGIM